MKSILLIGLVLIAVPVVHAQTPSFDGRWEMRLTGDNGPDVIVLQLQVDNDSMTGVMIRSNPSGQMPVPVHDLWIAIDEIRFTVKSPDGQRTVRFEGKLSGNEILFRRELQGSGGGSGIYGPRGPATVTAMRQR